MTDQMGTNSQKPRGDQTILTVAMPRDTNTNGDIFGGWLLSQMDIAGGVAASRRAQGRAVTVAVEEMEFHLPVHVGNLVACYAEIIIPRSPTAARCCERRGPIPALVCSSVICSPGLCAMPPLLQ